MDKIYRYYREQIGNGFREEISLLTCTKNLMTNFGRDAIASANAMEAGAKIYTKWCIYTAE